MPIDSVLIGGCSAADAISHADDAISKISLNAADMFAKIAGKNFLRRIKRHPSQLAAAKVAEHEPNSFAKVEQAALAQTVALETDLL